MKVPCIVTFHGIEFNIKWSELFTDCIISVTLVLLSLFGVGYLIESELVNSFPAYYLGVLFFLIIGTSLFYLVACYVYSYFTEKKKGKVIN